MTEPQVGTETAVEDREAERIAAFVEANRDRDVVVVQGLGFVGGAMVAALANARDTQGAPHYAVIGVDLPGPQGEHKIGAVQRGEPPIVASDTALTNAYRHAHRVGNVTATSNGVAFDYASTIVIDVNFDVRKTRGSARFYSIDDGSFLHSVSTVAEHIQEGTLLLVETTVPPGTTEHVVLPTITQGLARRNLNPATVHVAHSYERVMPGPNYLASITNYYRVFAGIDDSSSRRARAFLESFIDTQAYPLFEVSSTVASETAKVLENSFRAVNIALIQEWSEFAQAAGINLFEIIDAIRVRPTHANIMLPGFGVGGYCLTKDSLLADAGAKMLVNAEQNLSMAVAAIDINDAMPLHTLALVKELVPDLTHRRVVIFGVSYLSDVADTRFSPTEILYDALEKEGASVCVHDPLVEYWPEKGIHITTDLRRLPELASAELAVFAVRHKEYASLSVSRLIELLPKVGVVVDANNVLTDSTAEVLAATGIRVSGVGKGHWRRLPTAGC